MRLFHVALVMGLSVFAFPFPALSHVVLSDQAALAGTSYRATLRVGHGCEGSPTTAIKVIMPAGFRGAKPMPKAGWVLSVTLGKLDKPYDDHGKPVTEGVTAITWTAASKDNWLPDAWYDEFVLQARLPAKDGTLYWPVSQICEEGRVDWTEIPQAGQKLSDLKNPAAVLELMPAGGGEHKH